MYNLYIEIICNSYQCLLTRDLSCIQYIMSTKTMHGPWTFIVTDNIKNYLVYK